MEKGVTCQQWKDLALAGAALLVAGIASSLWVVALRNLFCPKERREEGEERKEKGEKEGSKEKGRGGGRG